MSEVLEVRKETLALPNTAQSPRELARTRTGKLDEFIKGQIPKLI